MMALFMTLFLSALGVQMLFMLLYTVAISRYRPAKGNDQKPAPVSIIICALNEIENLKLLIPKLLNQSHPDYEIIIVNDQSTDGTYEYLMKLKEENDKVRMVQINETPDHFSRKKYAITLGVKAAKHEVLVFTDADCYPNSEDWLKSMAMAHDENTQIVVGASLYEKKKGFLNQFIRYETYWTAIQYLGCALLRMPYMGVGRNMSYTKSLFLSNNGFKKHQHTVGGDDDIFINEHSNKSNTQVVIGNASLTYSYPKVSFETFFRQKMRHLSVGKFYKFKHKIILGLYTLSYLVFWITGVGLIFAYPEIIGIGVVVRMCLIYLMYYIASKKIGERYVPLILPLLDIVYGFYYIATTVITVFSKRIRWS